jgi:hypothetical protein
VSRRSERRIHLRRGQARDGGTGRRDQRLSQGKSFEAWVLLRAHDSCTRSLHICARVSARHDRGSPLLRIFDGEGLLRGELRVHKLKLGAVCSGHSTRFKRSLWHFLLLPHLRIGLLEHLGVSSHNYHRSGVGVGREEHQGVVNEEDKAEGLRVA